MGMRGRGELRGGLSHRGSLMLGEDGREIAGEGKGENEERWVEENEEERGGGRREKNNNRRWMNWRRGVGGIKKKRKGTHRVK